MTTFEQGIRAYEHQGDTAQYSFLCSYHNHIGLLCSRVREVSNFTHCFHFTVNKELLETGSFDLMDLQTDEDEHSIEMQLPYIAKVMERYVLRQIRNY